MFSMHEVERVIIPHTLLITIVNACFWYIFQKRELKRFYEKQNAEVKEKKAVEKEVELTNVLNLQQDVVAIFSTE